jgi:serine phosphatase RsbU (regulator of sigma subunit)
VYFSSVKYDFSKAKKLIDIALKVNEKYYDEKCNLRINFIVDNNLKHYLKNDTSFYVNKYELNEKLIRSGEVYYRNNNEVLHSLKSIFLSNIDLDNIHIDNDNNYNLLYDCEDYVLSKFQSYLIAFTYKLRNYNKQELLEKYKYKEKKYNIFIDRSTNVLIENISFITKAIENYLFGNFEEAFYFIKIASRDIDVQLGNFNEIMFRVFYNLIYLTQIKPSFSDKIIYKKNKKVIDIYAKYMPSNFNLYKNLLIAMENSYYKKTEKIDFYFQEALKDAQKQKSLFFEALIKESAANSFRNTSKKLSNLYFYEAYDSYKIFSAFSKMNNLALKYDIELVDNKKSDVDNKNGILNIDTDMVFLASQTLSKNIKTNDILKNMLKIILENIGANKGYIILNKGDEQLIVASVYNDKILLNENIPLSNEKNISHRVVNYINATNRNLLIDEAYTQKEYLNNTYIQSNKIKSILAMPIINNDEQKGILYCENNLISGIFSQDLIKTVSILLSQLIISLDNAFIYENMENLIEKRTEELNKTNQHINSSIKYASIIQKSLLAPSKFLQSYFSEYCLIWEPKDIVGGDIYFFNDFNDGNECLMMIIDCTGHGVAGAFVTMLVKAVEEQIVSKIGNNQMEINTAEILKEFNRKIKYILEGQNHHKSQNAGFDGGIMYYNKKKNIIKYSGACNNLYYMHNNDDNVNTVKGDRHSVGYAKSDINFEYKEHEIKTEKGMCFYLTTDGYIDQNGGENDFPYGKKKFIKNIQNNVSKSMKEQELLLMKTINDYQGTSERNDDITLLAIKI